MILLNNNVEEIPMVTQIQKPIDKIVPDTPRSIQGVLFGGPLAREKIHEYAILATTKWSGTVIAIWWLVTQPTSWVEWSCFIFSYITGIMGVVIGYHRFFTHRCFDASKKMQYFIGILAQLAAQGSVLRWASDHRRHHAKTEKPGDTHSPYFDSWGKPMPKWRGMLNAHFGWCLDDTATDMAIYGRGLVDDPVVMWCHRTKWFWYFVSVICIPALWGWVFGHGSSVIIGTVLIGGFLRINLVLHAVLAVNSVGHRYGYQRYKGRDMARNNWVLAILTLGDGWHNNHHEHPRSAFAGEAWWELDFCGSIILIWEKMGLVWNVKRMSKAA